MATSQTPIGYKITDKGVILGYRPEFDDNRQAPGYPEGVTVGMVNMARGSSASIPFGNGQYVTLYGEAADAYNSGQLTGDQAKEIANQIISKGYNYEPLANTSDQLAELYQSIRDTLDTNSRQMQEWMDTIQRQARRQARAIAEQKRQALQDLINSLKTQQESALMGITNSLQDAQQALEDNTFQQWLAARQAMANRGLAGSGIASDQDTRLLLAKQRDLAGIFRDAARQRFDVESQIGQSLEQAYRNLAGISDEEIASNIFQSLYEKGRSELTDQARLYSEMFSKLLPYSLPTVKEQLDFFNDQQRNQLDWAKLASDNNYNWAKLDLDYQRLALDQAKALIDQGKLDLDYWRTLGYIPDPSGKLVPTAETSQADRKQALEEAKARGYFTGPNGEIIPTEERRSNLANESLRGAELVARVNQWAEENKLAAGRLNLSVAEFQHKVDYDQTMLNRLSEQLKLDKDKTQLDALKSQLSGVDSQIRAYISLGLDVPPELADARNRIVSQISALFSSAEKKSNASGILSEIFKGWPGIAVP